jgi:hypothetical protein
MFKRIKDWCERNSVFLVSLAAILMVAAGAMMTSDRANAKGTIVGNEESCQSAAVTAAGFALYRQGGMTWAEAEPLVKEALKNNRGNPESYVKDEQDEADILQLAHSVWHTTNTDIQSIADLTYAACMKIRSSKNLT